MKQLSKIRRTNYSFYTDYCYMVVCSNEIILADIEQVFYSERRIYK